jgi:hypothetical protein
MDQEAPRRLHSRARESAAMPDTQHSSENLADWLQEVARRPWNAGSLLSEPSAPSVAPPQASVNRQGRRFLQNVRHVVALAALTIGYLQYYYLDIMVQIGALHKLVVFVPLPIA